MQFAGKLSQQDSCLTSESKKDEYSLDTSRSLKWAISPYHSVSGSQKQIKWPHWKLQDLQNSALQIFNNFSIHSFCLHQHHPSLLWPWILRTWWRAVLCQKLRNLESPPSYRILLNLTIFLGTRGWCRSRCSWSWCFGRSAAPAKKVCGCKLIQKGWRQVETIFGKSNNPWNQHEPTGSESGTFSK